MNNPSVSFHLIKAWLADLVHGDPEAGNVTTEHVLWAVAVVAMVAIVVAVLTNFINDKLALLS